MAIKLGSRYRDKISNFNGVAVGVTSWLTGCATVGLQPGVDKDGKAQDAVWFDEMRLEHVEDVMEQTSTKIGGPKPTPQRTVQGQ